MNTSSKKAISLLLASLIGGSTLVMSACGGGGNTSSGGTSGGGTANVQYKDTERDALVFSTEALDGNFNPFFATSGTDTNIIGHTQLGMLTTNEMGKLVYGDEYATVALDFKENTYKDGEGETWTDYSFIIKNDIKFSDGTPLTMDDVLFNLYVYLDPAYMGSSTIYSTKIKGLNAYRSQDPTADDSLTSSGLDATFETKATNRYEELLDYLDPEVGETPVKTENTDADIAKLKSLFKDEVTSDWNAVSGSLESYQSEYRFTQPWEVYYYTEGLISRRTKQNANGAYEYMTDADGKYLTTLDAVEGENKSTLGDEMNTELAKYTTEEAKNEAMKKFAIDTVYNAYTASNSDLAGILLGWRSGSDLYDEFVATYRSEYYEETKVDGELLVKTIEGIQTATVTEDYSGNALSGAHEQLTITIKGVDPKAVYNFSFGVAPLHYYSGTFEGKDYVAKAKSTAPEDEFEYGVCFGNKEFFDSVLRSDAKDGLPVGAGVYKASSQSGAAATKDTFFANNWVYFERNPYFYTVGAATSETDKTAAIHNANIKYINYRVVGSDKIIYNLEAGAIHFGQPNATLDNISKISGVDTLGFTNYETNGYGYVGINPKFVPDIEVRRAIMKAMNTNVVISEYYGEDLATVIHRPMSSTSWAYPKGVAEHETIAYTIDTEEIIMLVQSSQNWELKDNSELGRKVFYNKKTNKPLELTFTISGNTDDHPAYTMFTDAKATLEQCGFIITVTTDANALKKLTTGGMAVWAAAWSSTIDPDLYQVYHKDSTATSIKNWGYDEIFKDENQFGDEQRTINLLSEKIEQAREITAQDERASIYHDALDLIMELAVELPTYQRNDLVVYNKTIIDPATLNQDPSWMSGVIDKLWEVNYYQR